MRNLPLNIRNERRLKSLTGLSFKKYECLLEKFTLVYERVKSAESINKIRKRKQGGGRKGALPNHEIKLLFVLYYLKAYPTFDMLADRFGFSTSRANQHLHKLMPIVQEALAELNVMPKRNFENPESLQQHLEKLGGIATLLIDVTEREHVRCQDKENRNALYSGKKKDTPLKTQ